MARMTIKVGQDDQDGKKEDQLAKKTWTRWQKDDQDEYDQDGKKHDQDDKKDDQDDQDDSRPDATCRQFHCNCFLTDQWSWHQQC